MINKPIQFIISVLIPGGCFQHVLTSEVTQNKSGKLHVCRGEISYGFVLCQNLKGCGEYMLYRLFW